MKEILSNKIHAWEIKILRKIKGETRINKIRSKEIRKRLKVCSVSRTTIKKKQLGWYGHFIRMSEDRIINRVWEVRPLDKRASGRPRSTRNEETKKTLAEKGMKWRVMTNTSTHTVKEVMGQVSK